jgi:transcriptional regulator with XRE-family HTH domain
MKMTQPELGRKIAELRKAKGLTQEELVEKCNLSVRTLQRIESGEVVPRSHTIKVIFAALDYAVFNGVPSRFGQLGRKIVELFNFKIDTMKKLSVLSMAIAVTAVILLVMSLDINAQSASKVKKMIEAASDDYIRWFNSGNVDSLLTMYSDDACLVALGCGKDAIRAYFNSQVNSFKFKEMNVISVNVSKNIAVEKGRWVVEIGSGVEVEGEYLTEWHRKGKKWLIVNDISNSRE